MFYKYPMREAERGEAMTSGKEYLTFILEQLSDTEVNKSELRRREK